MCFESPGFGSIDRSLLVQSLAFSHDAVSAVNHNSAFETRHFFNYRFLLKASSDQRAC